MFISRLLFGATLLLAPAIAVADGSTAFMTTAGKTSQPIGHYEFCQSHAAECAVISPAPARAHLTPPLWSELVAVNAGVNLSVTAVTDEEIFGRDEVWAYPGPEGKGDCEDLALLKRRELTERGWPVGDLLMTVVRKKNGEGHAVLTVTTDRGDLILDNLQPRVLVWSDTDYQYIKRQSEFNTGQWTAIDDSRRSFTASVVK